VRPNSKVILPYEPGDTGHWEMEKRRKETQRSPRTKPTFGTILSKIDLHRGNDISRLQRQTAHLT
jgi:hypothetical protein